jgi:hypothetical protein
MRQIHAPDNRLHKVPADLDQFWVITVLSNPIRYKRRYELYWTFAEMCKQAGVKLITVEEAFGDRQFMVTEPNNPFHLQVRSAEELWRKENMLNLGIKHACAIAPSLGFKVREIAWVDADCRSCRPPRDWFEETWHQLQHYEFVQMWEYLMDLDYYYDPIGVPQPGFIANYIKYGSPNPEKFVALQKGRSQSYGTLFGRPGLAWAANLSALDKVSGVAGPLIDISILGAGDWYMSHGLLGLMDLTLKGWKRKCPEYAQYMLDWQTRAERWIKRDVGYVQGTVYHDFHGKKSNRKYGTRGQILIDNRYNPFTDIKKDSQGLYQLETWEPRQIKMRDEIRAYFRARSEDEIS